MLTKFFILSAFVSTVLSNELESCKSITNFKDLNLDSDSKAFIISIIENGSSNEPHVKFIQPNRAVIYSYTSGKSSIGLKVVKYYEFIGDEYAEDVQSVMDDVSTDKDVAVRLEENEDDQVRYVQLNSLLDNDVNFLYEKKKK